MESTYVLFNGPMQVSVETESIDNENLASNMALIRSECSIISTGTELARLKGMEISDSDAFPCEPGYGVIGRIEALGADISEYNVGDRVFFAGKHRDIQIFEHGNDHQWAHFFPVPHDLDPVDACMACMAQIAVTAPHISDIQAGDTVAVFGLGLVGNLAAQFYRLLGARVIGVDPVGTRCELAKNCGISETLDVSPDKQVEAIKSLTQQDGADICVDAVGHTAVIKQCVESTKKMGQILLLGTPRADFEGNITEYFHRIHSNAITVRGAHMWQFPLIDETHTSHSVERNFARIFQLIQSGDLKVRELISHVIKPEEAPRAYQGLAEEPETYTSVVIDWR